MSGCEPNETTYHRLVKKFEGIDWTVDMKLQCFMSAKL